MPGSPKGKKKLSKAEKEKLKKEEAERKAKEEEEARIAAEEEEKLRKEKEKEEEEERRKLENEERKKRKGQLLELDGIWESYRTTLADEQAEIRKRAKWARYMKCDGSPDPTVPGEINTYINLWKEDEDDISIGRILDDSILCLDLIDELQGLIDDTSNEEFSEDNKTSYRNTQMQLQQLLAEKLNLGTHDLLLQSSQMADPETMNLQQVRSSDHVTLCLWGNLSKNPRIKSFEFEEKGFKFDIPRILTLSDCAIRVLFTSYDHLSSQCKSFYMRQKKKIEEPPAEETEEKKEGEHEEGEEVTAEKEQSEGEQEMEREETKDVVAALNQIGDEEEEEKQEEEQPAEDAEPMEEDYEIPTPEPEDYEDFDGDEDVVDLRAYHVVGGVFFFDLLQLPPQPKTANSWIITQVVDPPELLKMDYVADNANPVLLAQKEKEKDSNSSNGDAKDKKEERPPIEVTLKLPETVYFCEEPQVCRWDDELKQWRLDGFTDHNFNEEQRMMTFKTSFFGKMALVQDAHINMPYQSWEIRPRAGNSAVFTIIAAIIEVEMEIKDGQVCLRQPEDRPELEHLRNNWMSPRHFIKAMRAAGVNLFPENDSSKYVSIQNKNAITEERLYQQMAMTASAMAFSWSKWNAEVKDDSKIIIQGAEHLQDEPLMEEDWSLFLITKKRTTKLKMSEFDEAFSEDYAEGTSFNADLYHAALEITTDGGKDRLNDTNYKFVDCVYQLLKATKVLTYA